MSEPTLVLEYELTRDRARAEFRHSLKARRRSWWRGVAGAGFLVFAVFWYLPNGNHVPAAIYGVMGIEFLFSIVSRVSLSTLFRSSSFQAHTVRFELDDRGIVRGPHIPKQSPLRYWWKSLRRVSEDDEAFDLNFGWQSLSVPQHAFADEDQRTSFRNLVASHLPAAHVVAAGR